MRLKERGLSVGNSMLTTLFKGMTISSVTQRFHAGHKAIDVIGNPRLIGGYGTPLCAPEDVTISRIIGDSFTPGHTWNLERGYGLWMRGSETGMVHFMWHTQPILPVWGGDKIKRGGIVAWMGNAGLVRQNGEYVPLEKRTREPYLGTHVHYTLYPVGHKLEHGDDAVDPMAFLDFTFQPRYSNLDFLKAVTNTVIKTGKLISKK